MNSEQEHPQHPFKKTDFPIYGYLEKAPVGWAFESGQRVFEHQYIDIERLRIHSPGRPEGVEWLASRRRNAVVVAPRLADGRFLLIEQERYPIARTIWEFPAGMIDLVERREEREVILDFAHQELAEETAHKLTQKGEMLPLGYYFSSPGFWDEHAYQFLATEVEPLNTKVGINSASLGEGNETIHRVCAFEAEELKQMIANNEIIDANTLSLWARLVAQNLV